MHVAVVFADQYVGVELGAFRRPNERRARGLIQGVMYYRLPRRHLRQWQGEPRSAPTLAKMIPNFAVGAESTRWRSQLRGADAPTAKFGMIDSFRQASRTLLGLDQPTIH